LALLAILAHVEEGLWVLVSSEVLELELSRIPDAERRERTLALLRLARERIEIGAAVHARAANLCDRHGFRSLDAFHVACAEASRADVFLTTDDALLRSTQKMPPGEMLVQIGNPLAWLTKRLAAE
jgi:predicted nucleic acid-binding protein